MMVRHERQLQKPAETAADRRAERAARDAEWDRWAAAMHDAIARMEGPAGEVARLFVSGVPAWSVARTMRLPKQRVYQLRKQGFDAARRHAQDRLGPPSTNGANGP